MIIKNEYCIKSRGWRNKKHGTVFLRNRRSSSCMEQTIRIYKLKKNWWWLCNGPGCILFAKTTGKTGPYFHRCDIHRFCRNPFTATFFLFLLPFQMEMVCSWKITLLVILTQNWFQICQISLYGLAHTLAWFHALSMTVQIIEFIKLPLATLSKCNHVINIPWSYLDIYANMTTPASSPRCVAAVNQPKERITSC